jgi:predicted acyltransferase (DUF342 family)
LPLRREEKTGSVDQPDSATCEVCAAVLRSDPPIMIAQHTQRSDPRAQVGKRAYAGQKIARVTGNVIAGEEHEIGPQSVHKVDCFEDQLCGDPWPVVEVRQMSDPQAGKAMR